LPYIEGRDGLRVLDVAVPRLRLALEGPAGESWRCPVAELTPYLIPASTGPADPMREWLDGWQGPVECPLEGRRGTAVVLLQCRPDGCTIGNPAGGSTSPVPLTSLLLDTRRAEVRDRLVRFLAQGERCRGPSPDSGDGGTGCSAGRVTGAPEYACSACSGTAWRRPPHNLIWITTAELAGRLTDWQAAAILWCSVARVRAEKKGPVVGWVGETREDERHGPIRKVFGPDIPGMLHNVFGGRWMRGAGDAHSLAAGFALLDTDGAITVPHPDGPIRLEVPDAT